MQPNTGGQNVYIYIYNYIYSEKVQDGKLGQTKSIICFSGTFLKKIMWAGGFLFYFIF